MKDLSTFIRESVRDEIVLPEGVIRHSFVDNNGKRHSNGYYVDYKGDDSRESLATLKTLIERLIDKRGNRCDLNDVDVSNMNDLSMLFYGSKFDGDISGWNVERVFRMNGTFRNSKFNGDLNNWNPKVLFEYNLTFKNSPLENNPPKWYKELIER